MKKTVLLLLALGLVSGSFAQNLAAELDSVMQAYQKVQHFNGTVLVAKNGQLLLEKGYGYENFATGIPNDTQTVYMIASITKQFTSAVVLKLVEQHKLALTDPLSKFFASYPGGRKITIYNLLTHTAGIPDYTQDSVFMASHKGLTVSQALTIYNKASFAPGTEWKYSNQGYQLLGEIIANVTGKTYFQAVRQYIFCPLNMTHSGFDFANLKSRDKATGYWTYPGDGKNEEASIIDSAASFSAGAIYSTVGDLYKWHQGLQAYKIVPKPLMDQAYMPFKNNYGFGWFVDSLYGRRVLAHSGDTYGFKSNIARITGDDVCVILLNNIEDEEMRGSLTNDLLAVLYQRPYHLPIFRKEVQLSQAMLKKYTGTYEMARQFSVEVILDGGQLWIQPSGQPRSQIYAEKEYFFFSKVVDGQVEFIPDASGNIVSIVLYQGGHQMSGKKIK
jgi:CubicO group peptidase (beta-lactamase class C family)